MKIDEHISGLLYDHDCVIVPDFGGFVGNLRPARLDTVRNRLHPPSKEISFNRNLTNNDGLLANRIARAEAQSYEVASDSIRSYVRELVVQLDEGQRVELEKIGTLYRDGHRNLRFEPDASVNYLRDAFGLASVHAPTVKRAPAPKPAPVPVAAAVVAEPEPVVAPTPRPAPAPKDLPPVAPPTKAEKRKKRRAIVWLPTLLLLLLFGSYLMWVSFYTSLFRAGDFAMADLNPFAEKLCPEFEPRGEREPFLAFAESPVPELNVLPDSVTVVNVSFFDASEPEYSEDELVTVRLREAVRISTAVATITPNISGRYHVIGGCFRYIENAEGLVAELQAKGFGARIYDRHRGLYRVTYNTFSSRGDALKGLAHVKASENSGAWLLVK